MFKSQSVRVSGARLEPRARFMRRYPTLTEHILWQAIRGGRLGVGFRRQVALGHFIVDFLAPTVRLMVEVDGGYHELRTRADARRTRWLERQGYRVVRVSSRVVFHTRRVAPSVLDRAETNAFDALARRAVRLHLKCDVTHGRACVFGEQELETG